jgi:hypothetical protein
MPRLTEDFVSEFLPWLLRALVLLAVLATAW